MWPLLYFFAIILTVGYCLLILIYFSWFIRLKRSDPETTTPPLTRFSIVIPARNEESNIENCLRSILKNSYPSTLFEIIVVDDLSTDATPLIVQEMQKQFSNIKLIRLQDIIKTPINSYKKKAIETAVEQAAFEWIITTDADCLVPKDWLCSFDAYIQATNNVFVAAPVKFSNNNSFLSIFQSLDFMSLQGITAAAVSAGAHSMCNGANLAYRKNAFYEVDGFNGISAIASGDDMLLMHKIKKRFPRRIGYLFCGGATVETLPMADWKSFIDQRIRWASKASSYGDRKIFIVLLLVYLFNLTLFLLPFLSVFYPPLFLFWLRLLLAKTVCEMIFMYPVSKFFGEQKLLWYFPFMQPFHIFYTVVSGLLGKFIKYEWKGRKVK